MNVIITGASRGIGKAIAEIYAANGYSLFLISRSEHALYTTMQELSTKYPSIQIKANPFDLANTESAKQAGKWALKAISESGPNSHPDILINNAGTFEPGSVHDEEEGVLENQIATNLYSAYHFTRTVLPEMIRVKSGHIFNMCSIASLKAYRNGGAYSISKFALYGFSQNLREELKPHRIKVTSILPGAVLTDSWGGYDNKDKRIMEAADIAKLVLSASQLSLGACVEDILIRPQLGDL